MSWSKFKILNVILGLCLILVSFNHCVGQSTPKKDKLEFESNTSNTSNTGNTNNNNSGNTNNGNSSDSVNAFGQTLHPITKMRCATCHATFQQPLHAVEDVTAAHNAVVDAFKVNFNNIPSSRMVLKLRDESHNCWSDCNANADEIQSAIESWNSMLGSQNNNQGGNNNALATSQSQFLIQELDPDNAMPGGTVLIETESASLVAPMVRAAAGNDSYIWVPNGNGGLLQNNNNAAGIGTVTFDTGASDVYKIYAYVDAPSNSDNSFHIRVDGGNYYEWHISETSGFEWREVSTTSNQNDVSLFIGAGNGHILEIRQREDGTKISKVVVTNDPNVNLSDVSNAVTATLTFDLNQIAPGSGATLQVDIQEYDMYSYKLSNPRITTNMPLRVKDVRPLINNQYNPQHATYTIVDMTVPVGTTQLSDRALIALKDMGPNGDKISFSFEILSAQ